MRVSGGQWSVVGGLGAARRTLHFLVRRAAPYLVVLSAIICG